MLEKTQEKKTSGLAIASLVLSLLFFIPLAPLVGIILAIVSLTKIKKDSKLKGETIAIIAIAVGVFTLILSITSLGLILSFIKSRVS